MNKNFLKIGHRGAKGHIAENTLESIQKALDLGVDGIEIDVHLCATGDLVVFHDFTLDRMTNGTGELAKKSLSDLKKLTVNEHYKIPTLLEVLDLIDKKCLLNIELKGKNTAFEVCKSIKIYGATQGWDYDNFLVSSFQHRELEDIYKIDKKIAIAVLSKASVEDCMDFANSVKAKAIHPNYALLTPDNVGRAQNLGYKVNTWTVNEKEAIQRMKSYGVDGIISDFPERL